MDTCCIGMPVLCICGCTACIGLIDCIGRGWPLFICEPPVACKPTAVKPFDPFGPPRKKNIRLLLREIAENFRLMSATFAIFRLLRF